MRKRYRTADLKKKYIEYLEELVKKGVNHNFHAMGLREKFPSELSRENAEDVVSYFTCFVKSV